MERLVRDLLSLSRVEGEERVRPREAINLSDVVGSVVYMLRPLARERGAELIFDPAEDTPVPGDADQLQQVFTNLIENAIKYGGTGTASPSRWTVTRRIRVCACRRWWSGCATPGRASIRCTSRA